MESTTKLSITMQVVRSQNQVNTNLQGDVVILNVKTGKYYGLNTVGVRIWELIENPTSVQKIHETIIEEYEVSSDQCEHDVRTLLENLFEAGLVDLFERKPV
jgi:hypothetical protein